MKQICVAALSSRVMCDAGSSIPATGNGLGAEGAGIPTLTSIAFLLDGCACLCSLCANSTHYISSYHRDMMGLTSDEEKHAS